MFPQSSSLVAIAQTVFVFCRVWIQRFLSWWLTALASTVGLELKALGKKKGDSWVVLWLLFLLCSFNFSFVLIYPLTLPTPHTHTHTQTNRRMMSYLYIYIDTARNGKWRRIRFQEWSLYGCQFISELAHHLYHLMSWPAENDAALNGWSKKSHYEPCLALGGEKATGLLTVLDAMQILFFCLVSKLSNSPVLSVCGCVWDVWKWGQVEGVPPAYLLYTLAHWKNCLCFRPAKTQAKLYSQEPVCLSAQRQKS